MQEPVTKDKEFFMDWLTDNIDYLKAEYIKANPYDENYFYEYCISQFKEEYPNKII